MPEQRVKRVYVCEVIFHKLAILLKTRSSSKTELRTKKLYSTLFSHFFHKESPPIRLTHIIHGRTLYIQPYSWKKKSRERRWGCFERHPVSGDASLPAWTKIRGCETGMAAYPRLGERFEGGDVET